jgi:hypothetical protein
MKRIAGMKRMAVAALVVSSVFSLTLSRPAAAQIVPPDRKAVDVKVAFFSGSPVYSIGFSYGLTPALDFTAFYSYQSVAGASGSLLDAGARYHFPVTAPGVDVYLSGGFASKSVTFPGFGTGTSSGISLGGGASIRLTPTLTGFAAGSLLSLRGTSNVVLDLGLQLALAPHVSGQLGLLDFAGSTAPYLGVDIGFP